ncbi:hypothetical protein GCM10027344_15100 [Spelaeicoccus albus]
MLLAGAAVVGVFSVLSGIGADTEGSQPRPMSQDEISRELASPTEPPDTTPPGHTPATGKATTAAPGAQTPSDAHSSPARKKHHRVAKQTTGGSVVASCKPGGAYLESWSPAPGYDTDDVHRGPARVASIEFEGDDRPDYLVSVQCKNGKPTIHSVMTDD